MRYLRKQKNGKRLEWEISDEERPEIGYCVSVGGGIGSIDGAGAMRLIESGGEEILFGCTPEQLKQYLGASQSCQYFIAYQSVGGFQSGSEDHRAHGPQEGGRIKGIYQVAGEPNVSYKGQDQLPVAIRADDGPLSAEDLKARGVQKCVVTIAVTKITTSSIGDGVRFGTTDTFDIMCSGGNPPKIWAPSAGSEVVIADCEPAPPNWKDVAQATAGSADAGLGVYFRGSIGRIPRCNWRYHKICGFMRRHRLGPWAPEEGGGVR